MPTDIRRRIYAALALICVAVLAVPFIRAHLQAIAVLDRVANQPVPKALNRLVSDPVTTTDITLPLPSGTIRARMYTPASHPNAPAIMVIHGVHYLGMNEPRLEAFATAMSSCGLRVLTPELPDIKDYHIGPSSIATIGDAATWLDHQNSNHPIGIMGLSFSGSLSLLAAADPQYRPSIKYVVAIGSEGSMSRVANYYLTGLASLPNGQTETLTPHEYGALVLEYENLQDFLSPADIPAVRLVLRNHLYEDASAERAAFASLTPAQAVLARQLMDTTSPATRRLIAASAAQHLDAMAAVSPHGHLAQLTTPVYLLHGEADNIIPSAETQWLASTIPPSALQVALISPILSHLDLDKSPTVADQFRLVHFFAQILHAAESR
jgi:pimeloyl-ACP methyl ester carboxylesterase